MFVYALFLFMPFIAFAADDAVPLEKIIGQLKNPHFISQKEIDQVFYGILNKFGTTITTKNFDEVYQCIKILLDNGANPNLDHGDETPIFYVMYHQLLIFKLENARLYEAWWIHSEPISVSDPWSPSVINDCPERTLIITQTCKLIDLLVEYGANPNLGSDDYIQSPLDYACNYMDAPEIVACLLKHGAQPNDFNEEHIFESCTSSDFEKYEKLFSKCSFSYLYISYKRYLIKKFLDKLNESNTNSLTEEQQAEIEQLKKAFQLRRLRLKKAKYHLKEKGAQNFPQKLGLRLLKKLGLKQFLEGALEELYDDLNEIIT